MNTFKMKKIFMIVFISIVISILVFSSQFEGFKGKCEIEKIRENEDKENWKLGLIKTRKEKDMYFKNNDTSPLAGKNRLTALNDGKYFLNRNKKNMIFLKKKKYEVLLSVHLKNKEWVLDDLGDGVKCFKDKIIIKSGDKLLYRSKIKFGKYTLMIYPLEKYLIATVFDPDRKIVKEFKGLKYYPLNYKYYADAKIERIKNPKKVIMLTSRNLEKTFYRYAKINFKIDNIKYTLFAYSSSISSKEDNVLFIPFTDKTTGKGSYYSGRYLEIPDPKGNSFKIDFHLAFNPLCNYSPAYNCAIPPQENNLKIKIEAGEMTYPVKGH